MPPVNRTRSRIPTSPCPVPALSSGEAGFGAGPLTTSTCRWPADARTETWVRAPGACRTTLASASCTIRYADRSTADGTSPRSAASDSSTGSPARTVASTSCWSRSRPGCGARSPSVPSLRSTDSSRRISPSDSRAAAAMEANSSRAGSERPEIRYGAESACTVITDMWCATTSCSSRAIRVRSSSSVRCARSASLIVSCSASRRVASPRSRTAAPITRTTAPRIGSSRALPVARSAGAIRCRTAPAVAVAAHTATTVRRVSRRPRASSRKR